MMHTRAAVIVMMLWSCWGGVRAAEPWDFKTQSLDAARPGVVYEAVSAVAGVRDMTRAGELRYRFLLPAGFERSTPRNIVVVLHDDGADCAWGFEHADAGAMRPGEIVVCLDGTRVRDQDPRVRDNGLEQLDAVVVRDVVLELTRRLPAGRIVLVGYGSGGCLACVTAGVFPRVIDGVVSCGIGAPKAARSGGATRSVPIAFVHGQEDDHLGFWRSVDARDAYAQDGHAALMLRRVPGGGHDVPAAAVSQGVDYCLGMSTDQGEVALRCARALATDLPGLPAMIGPARQILKRFETPGNAPLKDPSEPQKKLAWEQSKQLEDRAGTHVRTLQARVSRPEHLLLPETGQDASWIGHLVALVMDARGTDALEAYLDQLGYDAAYGVHSDVARDIIKDFERPDYDTLDRYRPFAQWIGSAYLSPALRPGLLPRLAAMKEEVRRDGHRKIAQQFADIQTWAQGRIAGEKLIEHEGVPPGPPGNK